MSMVKTTIKVLFWTFALPVIFFCLFELYNVGLTPLFVKGIINKAVEQSCNYFAQETYKRDNDSAVSADTYDIDFSSEDGGGTAVTGHFFQGGTQDDVYKSIYLTSDFRTFLDGTEFTYVSNGEQTRSTKKGLWENLDRLACGLSNSVGWGIQQGSLDDEYKALGRSYVNDNVTALNLGVTYLDKSIIEDITKWNMVANLYRGKPNAIHKSGYTGPNAELYDYVMYDGFKIYYNTFKIEDIEYTVYDLSTNDGAQGFNSVVHVGDLDYWKDEVGIDDTDERKNVCVAKIIYSMRVGYDGITPIKNLMKFVNDQARDVQGYSGHSGQAVFGDKYQVDPDTDFYGYMNLTEGLAYDENGYSLSEYNNTVYYYIVR